MERLVIFTVVLAVVGMAVSCFVLLRNEWVYQQQTALGDKISSDCKEYIADCYSATPPRPCDVHGFWEQREAEYLSYDEMMSLWTWHIWDLEKLRRPVKSEWPETIEV